MCSFIIKSKTYNVAHDICNDTQHGWFRCPASLVICHSGRSHAVISRAISPSDTSFITAWSTARDFDVSRYSRDNAVVSMACRD